MVKKNKIWAVTAALMLKNRACSYEYKQLTRMVTKTNLTSLGENTDTPWASLSSHTLNRHTDKFNRVSSGKYKLRDPNEIGKDPLVLEVLELLYEQDKEALKPSLEEQLQTLEKENKFLKQQLNEIKKILQCERTASDKDVTLGPPI